MLAGCSALRLTYNQGPALAYWWLDGYIDFTSDQAPRARAALDAWFAWHRATQLPDYAEQLVALQAEAVDNITPAQVCHWTELAQQRANAAYDHALPALAQLARSLSAAQIDHLEKHYAKGNAEAAHDFLQPDLAERRRAAFKRTLERAEDFYGTLDVAQRKLLADGLNESPFDPAQWLNERAARQQDILRRLRQLLAERADGPRAEVALRAVGPEMWVSPRPAYREQQRRVTEANCTLIARLHNAARPLQRRKAIERLRGWELDLRALFKAPRSARSPIGD